MGAVSGGGLSGEDFELHYHWLVFENQCLKRVGVWFQGFFEEIMGLHDDTFIAVKSSGVEGDWKCDGFSSGSGTVYQVYAPETMTVAKAVAKIREDFESARGHWANEMRCWVFVWPA